MIRSRSAVELAQSLHKQQCRSGAFGWRLSGDEVEALDKESSKLPSALGAPFENW